MNILVSLNSNYLFPLIVMLSSLLWANPADEFTIYVAHTRMGPDDFNTIRRWVGDRCEIVEIRVPEQLSAKFAPSCGYPPEMYYRILAAQLIPENESRILYLDPDILVINPIDRLYHMDFSGALFAASSHVHRSLQKINQLRLNMEEDHPYINSGVLMMNLDQLRQEQNVCGVLDFIRKNKLRLFLPDQDVISAVYGDSIQTVDPRVYNLSERFLTFYNLNPRNEKITYDWVRRNTAIIHYCGKSKPWNDNYRGKLGVFYQNFLWQCLVPYGCPESFV